jgi:hypothetical protein
MGTMVAASWPCCGGRGGGATVRRGLDSGRAKRPEGGGWAKVCMAAGV